MNSRDWFSLTKTIFFSFGEVDNVCSVTFVCMRWSSLIIRKENCAASSLGVVTLKDVTHSKTVNKSSRFFTSKKAQHQRKSGKSQEEPCQFYCLPSFCCLGWHSYRTWTFDSKLEGARYQLQHSSLSSHKLFKQS